MNKRIAKKRAKKLTPKQLTMRAERNILKQYGARVLSKVQEIAAEENTNIYNINASYVSDVLQVMIYLDVNYETAEDLYERSATREIPDIIDVRKADFKYKAENSPRSKTYNEAVQRANIFLGGDYWDLAEAAAEGRYEEAIRVNSDTIEMLINKNDDIQKQLEEEIEIIDINETDPTKKADQINEHKRLINDLKEQRKELDKLLDYMKGTLQMKRAREEIAERQREAMRLKRLKYMGK